MPSSHKVKCHLYWTLRIMLKNQKFHNMRVEKATLSLPVISHRLVNHIWPKQHGNIYQPHIVLDMDKTRLSLCGHVSDSPILMLFFVLFFNQTHRKHRRTRWDTLWIHLRTYYPIRRLKCKFQNLAKVSTSMDSSQLIGDCWFVYS